MKFLYDLFAKHSKDEASAKKKYKLTNVIIYAVLLIAAGFVTYRYISQTGFKMGAVVLIAADCFFVYCVVSEIFNKYTGLHRSHNAESMVCFKKYKGTLETKDPHGKDIFKFTLENNASVEGTYVDGKYVFTVKNDEWDEVARYTASDDGEYSEKLDAALEYANLLEKKPDESDVIPEAADYEDGEYDEDYEDDDDYEAEDGEDDDGDGDGDDD